MLFDKVIIFVYLSEIKKYLGFVDISSFYILCQNIGDRIYFRDV